MIDAHFNNMYGSMVNETVRAYSWSAVTQKFPLFDQFILALTLFVSSDFLICLNLPFLFVSEDCSDWVMSHKGRYTSITYIPESKTKVCNKEH